MTPCHKVVTLPLVQEGKRFEETSYRCEAQSAFPMHRQQQQQEKEWESPSTRMTTAVAVRPHDEQK